MAISSANVQGTPGTSTASALRSATAAAQTATTAGSRSMDRFSGTMNSIQDRRSREAQIERENQQAALRDRAEAEIQTYGGVNAYAKNPELIEAYAEAFQVPLTAITSGTASPDQQMRFASRFPELTSQGNERARVIRRDEADAQAQAAKPQETPVEYIPRQQEAPPETSSATSPASNEQARAEPNPTQEEPMSPFAVGADTSARVSDEDREAVDRVQREQNAYRRIRSYIFANPSDPMRVRQWEDMQNDTAVQSGLELARENPTAFIENAGRARAVNYNRIPEAGDFDELIADPAVQEELVQTTQRIFDFASVNGHLSLPYDHPHANEILAYSRVPGGDFEPEAYLQAMLSAHSRGETSATDALHGLLSLSGTERYAFNRADPFTPSEPEPRIVGGVEVLSQAAMDSRRAPPGGVRRNPDNPEEIIETFGDTPVPDEEARDELEETFGPDLAQDLHDSLDGVADGDLNRARRGNARLASRISNGLQMVRRSIYADDGSDITPQTFANLRTMEGEELARNAVRMMQEQPQVYAMLFPESAASQIRVRYDQATAAMQESNAELARVTARQAALEADRYAGIYFGARGKDVLNAEIDSIIADKDLKGLQAELMRTQITLGAIQERQAQAAEQAALNGQPMLDPDVGLALLEQWDSRMKELSGNELEQWMERYRQLSEQVAATQALRMTPGQEGGLFNGFFGGPQSQPPIITPMGTTNFSGTANSPQGGYDPSSSLMNEISNDYLGQ